MQVLDITKKAGQLGRELRQSQSDLVLPYRLCRWALDFCVLDFQLLWVDGGTRPMEVGDSFSHGSGADGDAMRPLYTMKAYGRTKCQIVSNSCGCLCAYGFTTAEVESCLFQCCDMTIGLRCPLNQAGAAP